MLEPIELWEIKHLDTKVATADKQLLRKEMEQKCRSVGMGRAEILLDDSVLRFTARHG
jgi:hypothetical protein